MLLMKSHASLSLPLLPPSPFFFFNYYFSGIVSREVWESETGLFLCYQDMFTQAPLMYAKHFIATLSFS